MKQFSWGRAVLRTKFEVDSSYNSLSECACGNIRETFAECPCFLMVLGFWLLPVLFCRLVHSVDFTSSLVSHQGVRSDRHTCSSLVITFLSVCAPGFPLFSARPPFVWMYAGCVCSPSGLQFWFLPWQHLLFRSLNKVLVTLRCLTSTASLQSYIWVSHIHLNF